jgi:signal transduction histidine kinase
VAAIVAYHAIFTVFVLVGRRPLDNHAPPPVELAIALTRLVAALPADQRAEAAARSGAADPNVRLYLLPADLPVAASTTGRDEEYLRKKLGAGFQVESAASVFGPQSRFTVRLSDGTRIAAEADHVRGPPLPPISGLLLGTLTFVAVNMIMLSLWASRQLTKPLARIARAAEEFSLEDKTDLPESGPEEVRILARALNRLRARIQSMVEDRTRMLAAIGHDLRTPITRLRLKAEFIRDETTRLPILRDLEQMNAMVHGALSYLHEGSAGRKPEAADVATLVRTICDEFSDMGHDLHYAGPDHVIAPVYTEGLQRAVTNLVDNAVKYGTATTVFLEDGENGMSISVADNGPGLRDEDKAKVVKPFARGDDARPLQGETGFGLGLAIADAVARAHRGQLTLLDNAPRGLIAKIEIKTSSSAME